MLVYLLIEERDQQDFKDAAGQEADVFVDVVGVYSELEKAEYEKKKFEEQNAPDPVSYYYIATRPLL